jgi:hypothetical protein
MFGGGDMGAEMSVPEFGSDGVDRRSFAPVELIDMRQSQWQEVRLSFTDWDHLQRLCGGDAVDGYYLNGYGVEGLIRACRLRAGLDPDGPGVEYDSEGSACFIHFKRLEDAVQTAQLASRLLNDSGEIAAMIAVARDNGFEDRGRGGLARRVPAPQPTRPASAIL